MKSKMPHKDQVNDYRIVFLCGFSPNPGQAPTYTAPLLPVQPYTLSDGCKMLTDVFLIVFGEDCVIFSSKQSCLT